MGLFDTLTIDPSLLPVVLDEGRNVILPTNGWQTKNLDEGMLYYRITADGCLEIERMRYVDPPPGGWPESQNGFAPLRTWPRPVHDFWEATTLTAQLNLCQFWTAKGVQHPTIPLARRDVSVTISAEVFRGRVQGPISLVELVGQWWEPLGNGWAPVGEDPSVRADRIERDRLSALHHRLRQSRRSPEERLLRILARNLSQSAYRQTRKLLINELKNPSGRYPIKRRRKLP
jgi:hypothetical protein